MTKRKKAKPKQGELPLKYWGGYREGAGRKPKGAEAGMPHDTRGALSSRCPVHVTSRLLKGLPNLRTKSTRKVLYDVFRAVCDRRGFRRF